MIVPEMPKDRRKKSVWLGPFVLSFDNDRCFSRFEALCYWLLQYLIDFQSNCFTKENARKYYALTWAAPCISVLWCVVYSSRYGKELFLIFRLIIVKYETALLLEWMLVFVLLFLRFALRVWLFSLAGPIKLSSSLDGTWMAQSCCRDIRRL